MVHACLTVQYYWRRLNDQLARANDPIYRMLESAGEPTARTRWLSRTHASFKHSRQSMGSGGRAGAVGARGAGAGAGGGGAAAKGGAATAGEVVEHLLDLKKLMLDMRARIERLEQGAPSGTNRTKISTPKGKKSASQPQIDLSPTEA